MDYRQLRPKIIKDRIQRHEGAWKRMNDILRERDNSHRKLNKKYGYSESDGIFGIGKRDHTDAEYVSKYDEIESKYEAQYSKQREVEVKKDIDTLSIWEYLLFDNIGMEVTEHLLTVAEKNESESWHGFIRERAKGEMSRWRKENTIGGIMKMIKYEKNDFSYRAARCRRDLNIGIFNLSGQMAILGFKSSYIRSLKAIFESIET